MAIKGKSKSRGTKAVARGPKPSYVPVKTPMLRRRGLWIAIGTLLFAVIAVALAIGFVQQRNRDREEDRVQRMADAVGEYQAQLDPILAVVGQPAPPATFDAYPALASAIGQLEADEVDPAVLESAGTTAESVATSAESAAGLLGEIPATDLVGGRGLSAGFVRFVLNSQDGLVRAARLYQEAALLVSMAVDAEEGRARDDLVARASGVHDVAEETFASAYADYVQAQAAAGVFDPTAAGFNQPQTTGPSG